MTEESYVHEPTDAETEASIPHDPAERTFDWRGWMLVGVVVVSFLVVPGVILALPYIAGPGLSVLGLTWRDTFLVLPLVPAFVLGATAVWATARG